MRAHSLDRLYAINRALNETAALGADDMVTTPSGMTGLVEFLYDFLLPLLCGATAVYADLGDLERGLQRVRRPRAAGRPG